MKAFAALYRALDESTSTNDKLAALEGYFAAAPPADAAWALHMLLGNRPRRIIPAPRLRAIAAQAAGIPAWLLDECYAQVGDLGETIALLVDRGGSDASDETLATTIEHRLLPLAAMDEDSQRAHLVDVWRQLDTSERFVWNKLLTGAFRVGAAEKLAIRAVARVASLPETTIAHRLMGSWTPSADRWRSLLAPDEGASDRSRPYPFCLATAIDGDPVDLGERGAWLAEWKWDGIRAQLVCRDGSTWLWSRGEELLAGRFPEIEAAASRIPDGTVLDGEILPWRAGDPVPMAFAQLQRRIQRKGVSKKLVAEVPVVFVAYDLLEHAGTDIRGVALASRRALLEDLLAQLASTFRLSPLVTGDSWHDVATVRRDARQLGAEGLMLKRADGPYLVGRKRGGWWKWKVDPYSVDAVLTAAQGGSGRRAGLFTDYTFAVWDGDTLVNFAKAYSASPRGADTGGRSSGNTVDRSDRFARWSLAWCSRSHSRDCSGRTGTRAESRCVFPGSRAGAPTSSRRTPTLSTRCDGCSMLRPELEALFTTRSWTPLPYQRTVWEAVRRGESDRACSDGTGKTWAGGAGGRRSAPAVHSRRAEGRVTGPAPPYASSGSRRSAPLPRTPRPPSASHRRDAAAMDHRDPHGDTPAARRARQRERLPTALITTPESATLLLTRDDAPTLFADVDLIVIDEWHELLASKRGVQVELLLARLRSWRPALRVWGLSATLGNIETAAAALGGLDPDGVVRPIRMIEGSTRSQW